MPSHFGRGPDHGSARSLAPRITQEGFVGRFEDSQVQSGPMRITRGMSTPRVTGSPGTITSRVNQGSSFVGSLASMTGDQTRLSDPVLFPDTMSVSDIQTDRPSRANEERLTREVPTTLDSLPQLEDIGFVSPPITDVLAPTDVDIRLTEVKPVIPTEVVPPISSGGPSTLHLHGGGGHQPWRHRRHRPVFVPYPYYYQYPRYPYLNFIMNIQPNVNSWQLRCSNKMIEFLDMNRILTSVEVLVSTMNERLPKRIRVAMEGSPRCPRLYVTDYSRSKLGYDASGESRMMEAWKQDALYGGLAKESWVFWLFIKDNAPITKEYVTQS